MPACRVFESLVVEAKTSLVQTDTIRVNAIVGAAISSSSGRTERPAASGYAAIASTGALCRRKRTDASADRRWNSPPLCWQGTLGVIRRSSYLLRRCSDMEVVAKEWHERRPADPNNIDAMIHTLDCYHARPNAPSWRRFTSVETALAHYELSYVGRCCLGGGGHPHLDRN